MKLLIIALMLYFSQPSFADQYVIENVDGTVALLTYFEASNDSLADVIKAAGLEGRPIKRAIPDSSWVDDEGNKVDRKYWRFNNVPIGNPISIDNAQRQADEAAVTQRQNDRIAVRAKMCPTCSDGEWNARNDT